MTVAIGAKPSHRSTHTHTHFPQTPTQRGRNAGNQPHSSYHHTAATRLEPRNPNNS